MVLSKIGSMLTAFSVSLTEDVFDLERMNGGRVSTLPILLAKRGPLKEQLSATQDLTNGEVNELL